MQRRWARHQKLHQTTTTTAPPTIPQPQSPWEGGSTDPFDGTAIQFLPSFSSTTPSPQDKKQQSSSNNSAWDPYFGHNFAEEEKKSDVTPASPATSGSSYVGWWPGTLDATGQTVAEQQQQKQELSRWTAQTSAMTQESSDDDSAFLPSPIRHVSDTSFEQIPAARQLFPRRVSLSNHAYLRQQADRCYPDPDDIVLPDDGVVSLSRDALREKNRYEPQPPSGYSPAAKGFCGLLNKTAPVPCLLDHDDSDESSQPKQRHAESDVFDGLSHHEEDDVFANISSPGGLQIVDLGMGLTAIQTSPEQFQNRSTANDYDDTLSESDVSENGFTRLPGRHTMMAAGRTSNNALQGISGNFGFQQRNDLAQYAVDPHAMEELVAQYRHFSDSAHLNFEDYEKEQDERKVFALLEMRSRIMESDIERGVERCGGATIMDDIATTSYYRSAHCIRDAMIVAKAWRDGATVKDVVHTAYLSSSQPLHYVPRGRGYWEARLWLDDADLFTYRCPSLAARYLRGFDMFTFGDCQSMLLKLANDRCNELREDLNEATARQIEAEEQMKIDDGGCFNGMMTDAEMRYLASMEEVKTISRQLVATEQSFSFVRERVESLIQKYERLLEKIETGSSFTGASSIISNGSDLGTEYWDTFDRVWARRAKRAEVKAELAAREALLSRTHGHHMKERQKEIFSLREQLNDLRSEASSSQERRCPLVRTAPSSVTSNNKDRLSSIKQRFRDRARKQQKQPAELELIRSAGEEMFQQKDFYQRSLRAVQRTRSSHH